MLDLMLTKLDRVNGSAGSAVGGAVHQEAEEDSDAARTIGRTNTF